MTELKDDIAEQAVILQSLKRGYGVLQPVGDRMPYDLVLDVRGTLVKIQIKSVWRSTTATQAAFTLRRMIVSRAFPGRGSIVSRGI